MDNSIKKLLSTDEVAEILMIGKNKLYKLLETGEIKGFRLCEHGTWRIPQSSVDEFIKKRTQK